MQYKIGKKNSAVIARVKIVVETALFLTLLFILKNIEFVAIVSKAATAIDFKMDQKVLLKNKIEQMLKALKNMLVSK